MDNIVFEEKLDEDMVGKLISNAGIIGSLYENSIISQSNSRSFLVSIDDMDWETNTEEIFIKFEDYLKDTKIDFVKYPVVNELYSEFAHDLEVNYGGDWDKYKYELANQDLSEKDTGFKTYSYLLHIPLLAMTEE